MGRGRPGNPRYQIKEEKGNLPIVSLSTSAVDTKRTDFGQHAQSAATELRKVPNCATNVTVQHFKYCPVT